MYSSSYRLTIGTKLVLVLSSIELVEEGIDGGLVLDINVLLDQSWSDDIVDVVDSLVHTFRISELYPKYFSRHVHTLSTPL